MKETTFDEQSSLKIYSLGIVIKSEDPLTKEIQVSPIESMNVQQPGVISQNKIEFRGSHPDDKGTSVTGNVKAENYVKAKWICIGSSNRVTAPDVYPNETVLLFRYSNNDVYYWTSIFHEPELRKKEAATFGISNLSVAKGWTGNTPIAYTKDTGYWLDIDAVKKFVSFTTPDNDGEFARYTFEIDVAKSVLTIKDNKTNVIKIDSRKGIEVTSDLKVVVKGKAQVDVESSKVINLTAPKVVVSGDLIVKGKITTTSLDVNQGAQVNSGLNVSFITTNGVSSPWAGKKDMTAVLRGSAAAVTTSTTNTPNTTGVGATDMGSTVTPVTQGLTVTGTPGYEQVDYNAPGTLNSGGGNYSSYTSPANGIVVNGGTTTYMGNSYINANGDQIHELSGTIIRSAFDLKTELESLKGNISQALYDSRLLYLNTPTTSVNGVITAVTSSVSIAGEVAKIDAAAEAASEIATRSQAYQVFLANKQIQINADPDSQASKDAISNPPNINPNQNPEFIAFYNSPAGIAATATLPPRAPVEVDTPLMTALRALQT